VLRFDPGDESKLTIDTADFALAGCLQGSHLLVADNFGGLASRSIPASAVLPSIHALGSGTREIPVAAETLVEVLPFHPNGIDRVVFTVDGTVVWEDREAPWVLPFHVPANAVPGTTSFGIGATATAVDGQTVALGTPITISAVDPVADDEPPTVALVMPVANTGDEMCPECGEQVKLTNGEEVLMSADVTDNQGIALVEFLVGGKLVANDQLPPYQCVYPVPDDAVAGPLTFLVRATDLAGNWSEDSATLAVESDSTQPAAPAFADLPSDLTLVENIPYALTVTSDDEHVAAIRFRINGTNVGEDRVAPFRYVYCPGEVSGTGTATVAVEAIDAAGNVSVPTTVVLTIVDDAAPTGSISLPADNATVVQGQGLPVSIAVSDDTAGASVELLLDGSYAACWECAPFEGEIPVPADLLGSVELVARITDAAGQSVERSVSVNVVANAAPVIDPLLPEDGLSLIRGKEYTPFPSTTRAPRWPWRSRRATACWRPSN
jgi:hypothetical protein